MLTVFTVTDIATDVVIMIMPIAVIWRLQLPLEKKVGLLGIFMLGLLYVSFSHTAQVSILHVIVKLTSFFSTIGAGIARMYIYLVTSYDKKDNPDFIAGFTLFILWSAIELNVAMIVCCMPVCGPVIAKIRDSFKGLGHKNASYPSYGREEDCLTERSKSFNKSSASYEMGTYRTAIATRHPLDPEDIECQLETPAAIVVRTQFSNTWKSS
ncbi:uncharacterized protein N7483_004448 [Penicillium malachiteum]|uniref:uncharacterized protein n=1 Tax=Penicillium malachiteum TaxID=1324776 RepID=UPI0025499636|nr:uncharacterized protein N7483_004448 [Penicillium malachiteum]KAJ5729940.1 hypothetical protein N7483_004448 [Penicillium malachiteum]